MPASAELILLIVKSNKLYALLLLLGPLIEYEYGLPFGTKLNIKLPPSTIFTELAPVM